MKTEIRLLLMKCLIRVFPVCYSDKHFASSSPGYFGLVKEALDESPQNAASL